MIDRYTLRESRSILKRYGYPSINVANTDYNRRELLTIGQYQPDNTNSGPLSDVARTVVSRNYFLTTPGTVLENLDIYGTVDFQAANIKLKNCIVRGTTTAPSSERGLVMSTNAAAVNCVIEDCLLQPQVPHYKWNGITGHDYTAKRVITRNTTDGFGVFNTSNPGGPLNVNILGSWVDKMVYWLNDDGIHTDGTHNDAIQIQGGTGAVIIGNRLDAYLNRNFGDGRAQYITDQYASRNNDHALSVLMVNNNNGVGPTSGITFTDNFLRGGDIGVNAGSSRLAGFDLGVFLRNKFAKDARLMQAGAPLSLNFNSTAVVNVGAGTADRNTYIEDGSEVLLVRN